MKRLLAVVVGAAVAACGSSGAETTRTGSQVPNIAAMPLPLKYLDCIRDEATTSESESYIGGTCRTAPGRKCLARASVHYCRGDLTRSLQGRQKDALRVRNHRGNAG